MTRTTMGGSGFAQVNADFDSTDSEHTAQLVSYSGRLVTRRTPTSYGAVCLIADIQAEHARRMHEGMHAMSIDVGATTARISDEEEQP